MKINWAARLNNRTFWVALVALLMVLANQVAAIFGVDITVYNGQVTAITETVLGILGLLGLVVDPTTPGLSDSQRVLQRRQGSLYE